MVMKIDRMDLADFGALPKIAIQILKLLPDLPTPTPIEDLALALGIEEITQLETDGFEGGLLTDRARSTGRILVNNCAPIQRQRFTIAHELGHFLSPWHEPQSENGFLCTATNMKLNDAKAQKASIRMEAEANKFAAEILMPSPFLRKDLRKLQGVDIEHILQLARRYNVSKEACTRRYIEMHHEKCAAVIAHKGNFLRLYKTRDFPFINLQKGKSVPRAKSNALPSNVTNWEETDAALWIDSNFGEALPKMYTQRLFQQSDYCLILLSIEEDNTRHSDDYYERSWKPRFSY